MASTVTIDLRQVGRGLDIPLRQIQTTVELLDEGNTVPFITRYRKDQTGGLDEEQIREIQERLAKLRLLADRKQTILRSIESQGKLTEKLAKQILAATTTKRLEDLYLPYKPKKQTLATLARSRGLETFGPRNPRSRADLRRSGRPGGRFRQHRPPGAHGRRRPVGRRPHPGRAVQRAGRVAPAAPRGLAADRRAGEQPDGPSTAKPAAAAAKSPPAVVAGRGAAAAARRDCRSLEPAACRLADRPRRRRSRLRQCRLRVAERSPIAGLAAAPPAAPAPNPSRLRPQLVAAPPKYDRRGRAAAGSRPPRRPNPRLRYRRSAMRLRRRSRRRGGPRPCAADAEAPRKAARYSRPPQATGQTAGRGELTEAGVEEEEARREEDQGLPRLLRLPRRDSSKIPPHRVLAINRGERAKVLRVKIESRPAGDGTTSLDEMLVPPDHPARRLPPRLRPRCARPPDPAQPGAGSPPRVDRPRRGPRRGRVRQEPPQSALAAAGAQPPRAGGRSRLQERLQAGRASTSSATCSATT